MPPRGDVSERSRSLCSLLKARNARPILMYAQVVNQRARECAALAGFFDSSEVLVPGSERPDPKGCSVRVCSSRRSYARAPPGHTGDAFDAFSQVRKSATGRRPERDALCWRWPGACTRHSLRGSKGSRCFVRWALLCASIGCGTLHRRDTWWGADARRNPWLRAERPRPGGSSRCPESDFRLAFKPFPHTPPLSSYSPSSRGAW
jgi:hypothetical protein